MSMSDIQSIVNLAPAINTPLLGFLAWLVWRLYSNHLPHLQRGLDSIDKRLARLEGRQEERDRDHPRSAW